MVLNEEVKDEIDAVEAIYPDLLTKLSENRILIKVPQHEDVSIQLSFPEKYPEEEKPHILEVSVDKEHLTYYDPKYLEYLFSEVMDSVFHEGQVCVFDFLTELDGILYIESNEVASEEDDDLTNKLEQLSMNPFEGWEMSDPITDRGSTFVAFAARVSSEEEAFEKLELLKTDNKMSRASHIMTAWRIKGDNGVSYHDCDDDGETAAGGRMLHLITVMDAWNVIVAVARWFGGAHIGPDRFKHINSTAREAVIRGGFVDQSKAGNNIKKSKKK